VEEDGCDRDCGRMGREEGRRRNAKKTGGVNTGLRKQKGIKKGSERGPLKNYGEEERKGRGKPCSKKNKNAV